MHLHFLDPYRPKDSPVHHLDARIKLVLALAFILTNALVPSGAWPVYILLFALMLSAVVLSELGVGYVLRRSVLALPFVLAALPLVLTMPGQTLFDLRVGQWLVRLSYPGLMRFISLAIKSWLSVMAAIVLASTTPFPDLLVAMRALRVPRLLVAIFGLMWRYLFVLVDEAMRLMRARLARSGDCAGSATRIGGSLAWRARVTGGMAGSLLLRAFERSDRIYNAMLARGYDGEARSLPMPKVPRLHWAVLAISLVTFGLLLGYAYLL